jgi:putative ABC transport system permease protein
MIFAYTWKNIINKKQRVRNIVIILGVAFTLFLLSNMIFLIESSRVSLINDATKNVAEYDYSISRSPDFINAPDFFELDKINAILQRREFRMVNYRLSLPINGRSGPELPYYFIGLNFSSEIQNKLIKIDSSEFMTGISSLNDLSSTMCVLINPYSGNNTSILGSVINISLSITDASNFEIQKNISLTVAGFIHISQRFMSIPTSVAVKLQNVPEIFQLAESSKLVANIAQIWLKSPEMIYDVQDYAVTEARVKRLASEIQLEIGLEWRVYPEKLLAINQASMLNTLSGTVLTIISFATYGLSGLLIYGVISTSMSERLREFGILRTLGGKRRMVFWISIVESFILFSLASGIGWIGAYGIMSLVDRYTAGLNAMDPFIPHFQLILTPYTILLPIIFSIGASVIVGSVPAFRTARMTILNSMNPYLPYWHQIKEKKYSTKLVFYGLILSFYGVVIFLFIPFIFLTLNIIALVIFVVCLNLSLFLGLTLIVLGFRPLFERVVDKLVNRSKRLQAIITANIQRYKNRNISTATIIAFSFAFIFFVGNTFEITQTQITNFIAYSNGADLVIHSSYSIESQFTMDDIEILKKIEGIEYISACPMEVGYLPNNVQASLFDYADPFPTKISLIGLDLTYIDAVYSEYIKTTQGEFRDMLETLYTGKYAIISSSLAEKLDLKIGASIQLNVRGDLEISEEEYIVIGIVKHMPGYFESTRSLQIMAEGAAVFISIPNYRELCRISEPLRVQKFFIKAVSDDFDTLTAISDAIKQRYPNYFFRILNTKEQTKDFRLAMTFASIMIESIGWASVLLAVLGVLSSASSMYIERTRDIGILRTLGLYNSEIKTLFFKEILIYILGAGSAGMVSGITISWILYSQINLFIQIPTGLIFPWGTLLRSSLLSYIIVWLGISILFRIIHKKRSITEILRLV